MKDFDPKQPSRGLGDSIAKLTHALGIDKLADKVAKTLGEEDCGCEKRQEFLNTLIPYSKPKPDISYLYTVVSDIRISEELEYKAGEVIFIDEDHILYKDLQQLLTDTKLKQQS